MMTKLPFGVTRESIESFCGKWKIQELAVFGSVLENTFGPESDIDVLATFAKDAEWSIFDHSRMSDELSSLLGRRVDIVDRSTLTNPFRRHEILTRRQLIYGS
jgi:predicted nucleotidyltransferase